MNIYNLSSNIRQYLEKKELKNKYYFPRNKIAKNLTKVLKDGGDSFILLKERRKGKTSFLLNELSKEASEDFYVFYHSFMKELKDKTAKEDFVENLNKFIQEVVLQKENKFLNNKKIEYVLKINMLKTFQLKVNGKIEKEINEDNLFDLFQVIKELSDKPILLLLDEIQEISLIRSKNENIGFIKDLRTNLDMNKNKIKTIFAGSSFNDLSNMFQNYNEPFYKFGGRLTFKDLEDDFLEYCIKIFEKETNKKLNFDDVKKIYEEVGKTPIDLIEILLDMEINDEDDIKKYFHLSNFKTLRQSKEIYQEMSEIEKVVIKRILFNGKMITSKNALEWMQNLTQQNEIKITADNVRYAIKKLKEKNIIINDKNDKIWKIINYELIRFLNI